MTVQKAAGIIQAAYFLHGRADSFRRQLGVSRWSNAHVANFIDQLADDLKVLALVVREETGERDERRMVSAANTESETPSHPQAGGGVATTGCVDCEASGPNAVGPAKTKH